MIRLLKVELTRLRCRRAALVLLLSAIAVPIVMALVVTANQPAPSDAQQARAEQQAQEEIARCVKRPKQYGLNPKRDDVPARCAEYNQTEFFYYDDSLNLDYELDNSGPGMASVLGVLMFLLGTTFVGHDWATGSMSNQLLFEPRRLRIWGAKAAAVALAALVVTAVGAMAFWLLLYQHYASGSVDPRAGLLGDCLQQGGRAAVIAAAAGVGGYAVTMLLRSTVFALGALFIVAVAGGILIGLFVDDRGWVDPTLNAKAVITDGADYYIEVPDSCYSDFNDSQEPTPGCRTEGHRSLEQGVTYLAILMGAVGAASAGSFRRRDVP
ncbi:hypothetical protein BH11ACT8_BH11ACT8_32310 [soil metagenome]